MKAETWLDEVVGRWRDSKSIGDERGAEIIHLVVEDDARGTRHHFRAETAGKRGQRVAFRGQFSESGHFE